MAVTVEAGVTAGLGPEIAAAGKGPAVDAATYPVLSFQDQGRDPALHRSVGHAQPADAGTDDNVFEILTHDWGCPLRGPGAPRHEWRQVLCSVFE